MERGMKKLFSRIHGKISRLLLHAINTCMDSIICGQSLVEYVPSVYRDDAKGVGMTGSQSTHYLVLNRIFSHVTLSERDSFLDVGCGKGRVLAFLLKKHAPCKLSGIEINEAAAQVALDWTRKYKQVKVKQGDAFRLDYNAYTVLFMGRPFLPKTFLQFLETLETNLTHPIRLVYWVDQQSGYLLKDRPGWRRQFRETLKTVWGLKISRTPQSYSIWDYDPALKSREEGRCS